MQQNDLLNGKFPKKQDTSEKLKAKQYSAAALREIYRDMPEHVREKAAKLLERLLLEKSTQERTGTGDLEQKAQI